MADNLIIGFSTGCFYRSGLSLLDSVELCHYLGLTAIEVVIDTGRPLEEYRDARLLGLLSDFDYVSIHAPKIGKSGYAFYTDVLPLIAKEIPNLQTATLHPDEINHSDWVWIQDLGVPFALENMDKNKKYAHRPDFFIALRNRGIHLPYVLDVQHTFEHDPSMQLAAEFFEMMQPDLRHLHVSGETANNNHSLTYMAENNEEISSFVAQHFTYPIILEGVISSEEEKEIILEMNSEIVFWEDLFEQEKEPLE